MSPFAVHMENSIVDHDLWRQWQAFAALLSSANPAPQAQPARDNAFGFAPFIDAAERFTVAARSFVDGADHGPAKAANEAARTFSDFLREQFADFQMPWSAGLDAAGARSAPAGDSPAFGPTREHQQRWQRTAEAWRRIGDAQRRLQRLWSDALREAATAFAARLRPPQAAAMSAEEARKFYDLWIECAEEAYARAAHGDAFCDALSEFVNASSQWRRELQASIEHSAKLLDLPTRSEINTLMRRLRSVEEQLRTASTTRKPRAAASGAKHARREAKPSHRRAKPSHRKAKT
jgi:Poly(R)-hydroxyalkanoic acid synthase subunit (PHA_synth_III_E)